MITISRLSTTDIVISDRTGESDVVNQINEIVKSRISEVSPLKPVHVLRMMVRDDLYVAKIGAKIVGVGLLILYRTFTRVETHPIICLAEIPEKDEVHRSFLGTFASRARE